jgi:hypothetical protein
MLIPTHSTSWFVRSIPTRNAYLQDLIFRSGAFLPRKRNIRQNLPPSRRADFQVENHDRGDA